MFTEMEWPETTGLTTNFKTCSACKFITKRKDNYCRRCGVALSASCKVEESAKLNSSLIFDTPTYDTAPLKGISRPTNQLMACNTGDLAMAEAEPVNSISQKLVNTLVSGVQAELAGYLPHKLQKTLVAVILSVPLWLMIILLSPFDAYMASKSFVRQ